MATTALLTEQHVLHALLENSPDYIFFKDRQSRFLASRSRIRKRVNSSRGFRRIVRSGHCWMAWLASEEADTLDPVERAGVFHHEFTRIHPFRDGNGRTARALMTLRLRREGFEYEVLVLQRLLDEGREGYIGALRRADAGDLRHVEGHARRGDTGRVKGPQRCF